MAGLQELSSLSGLQALSLNYCNSSEGLLQGAAQLTALRSLSLQTETAMEREDPACLSSLTNLTFLRLSSHLEAHQMPALAPVLANLQLLHMDVVDIDCGALSYISRCEDLRAMRIDVEPRLEPGGGCPLPRLSSLSLFSKTELLMHQTCLTSLRLSEVDGGGPSRITSDDACRLAADCLPLLRVLQLDVHHWPASHFICSRAAPARSAAAPAAAVLQWAGQAAHGVVPALQLHQEPQEAAAGWPLWRRQQPCLSLLCRASQRAGSSMWW